MGRSLPPAVSGIQKRLLASVTLVIFVAGLLVVATPPKHAYAAQITNRALTLLNGTVDSDVTPDGIFDGGSRPSGVVTHQFTFAAGSATSLRSVKIEYCTIASGTCTPPTGLSITSSTFGSSTSPNTNGTAFSSYVNSTTNTGYFTRATPGTVAVGGNFDIRLNSVTNPSAANTTFYARLSTYTSGDATTGLVDEGTVAASTATQIVLTGTMPESLIFCAGSSITVNGNIPDCSNTGTGSINFNQLFSPSSTATATSDMAASTNALYGYSISVSGPTLTSGSNTIRPASTLSAAELSAVGSGQFGMNLVDNSGNASPFRPDIGQGVTPASALTTNYQARPAANYATNDTYYFNPSGDVVAKSDFDVPGTAKPSDAQRYTVSYIVNVSGSQVAGTYKTTLTYVCTALF